MRWLMDVVSEAWAAYLMSCAVPDVQTCSAGVQR